jgi:hypothetical protein
VKSVLLFIKSGAIIFPISKGADFMKTIGNGIIKFFVANLLVIFTIIILPVFLVTDQIPLYNSIIEDVQKAPSNLKILVK